MFILLRAMAIEAQGTNSCFSSYKKWVKGKIIIINFTSKDYLPNSEERVDHLRKIINGRPVAILAAGPSIKELENRIDELHNADICYFGFNNFSVQETYILPKIDRRYSVVAYGDHNNLWRYTKSIINFLNRDEDNMFVSTFYRHTPDVKPITHDFYHIIRKYDKKLIFIGVKTERTYPNINHPLHFILSNTLLTMIQLAIIGKASRIVIFGADGYCKDNGNAYYENLCGSDDARRKSVIFDTNKYFNPIAPIAIRNVYKTYNLAPIEILNCCEDSACTPFPIVSYNDAFDILFRRRKFQKEMDLRIPKASIISLCLNTGELVKETVENILRQSYKNQEHIIVYNETDNKIQDIKQQFIQIKWIPEKNIEYIHAFKKSISLARGDYIFQCRIGDGYLNEDWFNTCVEVLENNPDISLVWGLSQNMYDDGSLGRIVDSYFFDNPPSQREYFIYYWLKKKVLFPEGNFCVRKKILEECFPFSDSKVSNKNEAWATFNYKFNVLGYQPYFVPIVANYCRVQDGNEGQCQSVVPSMQNRIKEYYEEIEQYKKRLLKKNVVHCYRDGSSKLLPGGFNRSIFIFFDILIYIKAKLPCGCLLAIEKALLFWRTYRWDIFRVVIIKVWFRLLRIMIRLKCKSFYYFQQK